MTELSVIHSYFIISKCSFRISLRMNKVLLIFGPDLCRDLHLPHLRSSSIQATERLSRCRSKARSAGTGDPRSPRWDCGGEFDWRPSTSCSSSRFPVFLFTVRSSWSVISEYLVVENKSSLVSNWERSSWKYSFSEWDVVFYVFLCFCVCV